MSRVIVCGGRDFQDAALLVQTLDNLLSNIVNPEIVSGHARDADSLAERYAVQKGVSLKVFEADWNKHGGAAGPLRNQEMLDYAQEDSPVVIAFWDGTSRGTKDMIDRARKAGVKVYIQSY